MIELRLCIEGACANKGAYAVFRALAREIEDAGLADEVELSPCGCLKDCNRGGVCAAVGDDRYSVYPETAAQFVAGTLRPLAAAKRERGAGAHV